MSIFDVAFSGLVVQMCVHVFRYVVIILNFSLNPEHSMYS